MSARRLLVASFYAWVACGAAVAGGPHAVNGAGQPMAWSTAGAVSYNPENGPLGQLTNVQARALLAAAFAEWQAGPATISFAEGSLLGVDVSATGTALSNAAHYQNFYRKSGDSLSPVIFDNDGSIIDGIFGTGARFDILGVAGLDTPVGVATTITEASIVINGMFFDGVGLPSSPDDVSQTALKAAMVHEIGHFINLDHSVLNHELAFDGNAGNDIYVPTMFPVTVDDEEALATTNPDDQLAAENLYPPGAPANGFTGRMTNSGGTRFQGVNVVFRKTDDPLMTSYSIISGDRFFPCNPGSACDPCNTACDPGNPVVRGSFSADFFVPGSYKICVEQIDRRFTAQSGTFVGPLATPALLPGPEECYDAAESGTAADDPDDFTAVAAGLGTPINIALDALPTTDAFEPNNTFGTATVLADLTGGSDTAPAFLDAGDLDVYQVPVVSGQRVRIDIDAKELDSSLDAVVGFYNASNVLVALVDDAVDPDTGEFSLDPAIELIATFTGTAKLKVSSYPDLDQDGIGGGSTGGYWLRVEVATDTDGDGAPDAEDICPTTAKDDADRDGVCFGTDNCPTFSNPGQDVPIKISAPLVAGGTVTGFAVGSDNQHVVYFADQEVDNVFQIYSVPITGGTPVRLNPDFGSSARDIASFFFITFDSTRVVYLADQDVDEEVEVYSVPITGGISTQLNDPLVANGDVIEAAVSPDSSRVVYRAEQDVDGVDELYSVPIAGGTVVKLNGTLVPGGSLVDPPAGLSSFQFSRDSSTVVYEADQDTVGKFELYSVPIAGGTVTKLNGALAADADVYNFRIDRQSSRVFFTAGPPAGPRELYSVPLGGGTVVKLNGTMASGAAGVEELADFGVVPDGTYVIYEADQEVAGRFEVYAVPAAGGTAVKLNAPLVASGRVDGFAIPRDVADGTAIAYYADQEVDEVFELYGVPWTGGTPVKISGALVPNGDVFGLFVNVVDSAELYVADQDTDEKFEVYTSPTSGGPSRKISGSMIADGDFVALVNATSSKIALRMDKDADEVIELYGAHMQGGEPLKLSGPMVSGGDVVQARTTLEAIPTAIVYRADQEVDNRFEVYARRFSLDRDADGVFDECDLCPTASDPSQADADGNGAGDACQACSFGSDDDADGVCGPSDNCPTVANVSQADFDADGAGDACDVDDDNDGLLDTVETNTGTYVGATNTGSNPFDADSDNDGVTDGNEVAGGTNPNSPASASPGVPFDAGRVITATADGASSVFAADVDGDGDTDLLSASESNHTIAWYENTDGAGTFGAQQVISTLAISAWSVFAADVDGDGDTDALSASGTDDKIAWYENVDGAGTFGAQQVISTLANDARSVFAADIDGDGDTDVLSASSLDDKIAWYENTDGEGTFGAQQVISTLADSAYSVFAADVDGDGDTDVLSGSVNDDKIAWYENTDGEGTFSAQQVVSTLADGARSIFAADIDGDGDTDVLSASGNDDEIAWYENTDGEGTFGAQRVISTLADLASSVFAADVDGDGDADVLSASWNDDKLAWYENLDGAGTFSAQQVISALADGAYSVITADIDRDGDTDVLSTSFLDDTIAWYENRTIHRSASFPAESLVSSGFSNWITSVVAADLDRDGDADVLSSSGNDDRIAWYESDGATPPVFTARTIAVDVANFARSVFASDLDDDGDLDALSASWDLDESQGRIAWFENDGASTPSWNSHPVVTTVAEVDPCENCLRPEAVVAADMDGDGDQDIVAGWSSLDPVVWYANLDGAGTFGPAQVIYQFNGLGIQSVLTADVDGDGDTDVVSGSRFGNKTAWYENDGTPGGLGDWAEHRISFPAPIASVFAGDLDGDGDVDMLSTSPDNDEVAWYENDGTPAVGGDWTARHIATLDLTGDVFAVDMDGDGDLDVLASSEVEDKVAWYENSGTSPPTWSEHSVVTSLDYAMPVFAADMDSDGAADILSADSLGTVITLYLNRGGQFSLSTTSLAPATIGNGATVPLFAIDFASNARQGDSDVELATLELLLTKGNGNSLSTEVANRMIQRVRVYLDNGSSVFEPGSDTLVATVEDLTLAPLVIPFASGDPRVRLAAGQSKRLFVVVETALDASSQAPGAFIFKHSTDSSKGRDATTGALLETQFASTVTTPTMTVIGDVTPPFVTSVFPAAGSVDVTANTNVVVFMSEPVDAATASAGVSLALAGTKVAGAVRVSSDGRIVTFDPSAPLSLGGSFQFKVTNALKDRSGNAATPFTSTFESSSSAGSGTIEAGDLGDASGGSLLEGANANDNSGFSAAALEDVNATTLSQGISDLIVGAPNADAGAVDAGEARLVFGAPGLQSNAGTIVGVSYRTAVAGDFVGDAVAPAGDVNHDGIKDFLIGAPRSSQSASGAGVVYVVFGNPGIDELAPGPLDLGSLAACASPTLCGVKLLGAASGDAAGASLSRAGDVNADGFDDILIGAPGADPAGRADAGVVYLIFGPLAPGTIALSSVGTTTPGLVLRGETAGDHLGTSVSQWEDRNSDGIDDMLLGAPDATSLDEFGAPIPAAGYVYAVQGGRQPGHLVDTATPGIIELSRVANGAADQVAGMVFLGATPNGALGRSLTGAVDTDGNGVDDILIAGNGEVYSIPGDGPKTVDGGTRTGGQIVAPPLSRTFGALDAIQDFGAARFVAPDSDPLTVGAAGDLNRDGFEDFIVGAPQADGPAGVDAGRAYVVLGTPAPEQAERSLADVGGSIAGFVVEGAEAGDNLGASVGGGQDVNADGVSDGLVGAPFADTGAGTPSNAGATYVISPLHPEEVQQLTLQKIGGTTRLEWSVPDLAATYNVYSGLLSAVRSNAGVRTSAMTHLACGSNVDTDTDLLPDYDDVTAGPAAGEAFVYLVTARNVQGEGPLGSGTPTRSNDAQCP